LSCSINSALTPISTSSFTLGWSFAKRPSAGGSAPPATSSTTPRRAVPDISGAARRPRAASSLQQATRVAEQHLAIVGQVDAARCPPGSRPPGLELKPLDLLAYGRNPACD
jgi:hypothetical protein